MPHRIIWSWYTGCYIWYSEEGTRRGRSPPWPLLAIPNVTAKCNAVSAGSPIYITDKLQCVLNTAAHLVTGTYKFDHGLSHMGNCTGSTLQNASTTNWESQSTAVCSSRLLSSTYLVDCCTPVSDIPSRRHLWSATQHHLTVKPAQHFQSLGLLCRSDGLELATRQSSRPGTQQQQLQTIAEDESISLIPLSTHSAVKMLNDSVIYKSIIDIDIDFDIGVAVVVAVLNIGCELCRVWWCSRCSREDRKSGEQVTYLCFTCCCKFEWETVTVHWNYLKYCAVTAKWMKFMLHIYGVEKYEYSHYFKLCYGLPVVDVCISFSMLMAKVVKLKLQCFGHVARGSAGQLALTVLEGSMEGTRYQGKPRR